MRIRSSGHHGLPKARLVDITLQMCTPFDPDERTINTIIAKPLR